MFYTEYRPQKFADLIGADHIVLSITSALANSNAPHAYFFTGGRGIGKTTTARLLAKALTCTNPKLLDHPTVKFEPCGECKSCKMIQNANHLDVIEIDAASNRGIDDIRTLKENIALSPTLGSSKVYIIDEIHMLSNDASNALLKTLEEPPQHAYFVLCTTNPEKVLDTIKSRCIQIVFKRPQISDLVAKITKIATDKEFNLDAAVAHKIALIANGAYREAETYLEQIINGNLDPAFIDIKSDLFNALTDCINKKQTTSAINVLQQVLQTGINIETWINSYIEYLRLMLFAKAGVSVSTVQNQNLDPELLKNTTILDLKNYLQKFIEAMANIKYSPIAILPFEIAIIELTYQSDVSIDTDLNNKPAPKSQGNTSQDSSTIQITGNNAKKIKKSDVETDSQIKPQNKIASADRINLNAEIKSDNRIELDNQIKLDNQIEPEDLNITTDHSKNQIFDYPKLLQILREKNHSIYLLLNSCKLKHFDGEELSFMATYSFHKERMLSGKIRKIIEDTACEIANKKILIKCEIDINNPKASDLTDKNIVSVKKPPLQDVFQNVFGDELEILSE